VLALVVAGGGAAAWWWQERTARVRDVEAALDEAARDQKEGRWQEVRAALERAEGRLGEAGPAGLPARLRQARADADLVAELDEARLKSSEGRGQDFDWAATEGRYAAAFARYGIAAPGLPAPEAAARVRQSAVRDALLAALEDWRQTHSKAQGPLGVAFSMSKEGLTVRSILPNGAVEEDGRLKVGDLIIGVGQGQASPLVDVRRLGLWEVMKLLTGKAGTVVRLRVVPAGARDAREYLLARGDKLARWLEEVVQAADDDDWRQQFREAEAARDTAKLKALVGQERAVGQPPSVVTWLGFALLRVGLEEEGIALWRKAQQRNPGTIGSTIRPHSR
jgi:hypothetical protein